MFRGLKVVVENERFEKALRLFKKKVDDDGLLKELRDRECFTKPSISRKLKKSAAKKRWQKFVNSNKLPDRKY